MNQLTTYDAIVLAFLSSRLLPLLEQWHGMFASSEQIPNYLQS